MVAVLGQLRHRSRCAAHGSRAVIDRIADLLLDGTKLGLMPVGSDKIVAPLLSLIAVEYLSDLVLSLGGIRLNLFLVDPELDVGASIVSCG